MSLNKKCIYSVIGYMIASLIPAMIWHMFIFADKYEEMGASTRMEPIVEFGLFSMLIQAFAFSYFYPRYLAFENLKSSFKTGIKFNLIMGSVVWSVMVFATAAKFDIDPVWDFVALGTCFQMIQYVCVGLTFGLIYREI